MKPPAPPTPAEMNKMTEVIVETALAYQKAHHCTQVGHVWDESGDHCSHCGVKSGWQNARLAGRE